MGLFLSTYIFCWNIHKSMMWFLQMAQLSTTMSENINQISTIKDKIVAYHLAKSLLWFSGISAPPWRIHKSVRNYSACIVPLPKSQSRHLVCTHAPLPLSHSYFDLNVLYKILLLLPFVIAKSRLNASGISSRHVVFEQRLGDLLRARKTVNRGRCL